MSTNQNGNSSASIRLLTTCALLLVALVAALPQHTHAQNERCFDATGFCISGSIRSYWEHNGGLPVFGYPITPQRTETIEGTWTGPVQWFERDRLEDHGAQGVMAGRLGDDILARQGIVWQDLPRVESAPTGCRYFPTTGHSLCNPFLGYWERNGGLERFGYPITEPFNTSIEDWSGPVQYFERRRMEHHTEHAGTDYEVLLGLLGNEIRASSNGPTPPPVQATSTPSDEAIPTSTPTDESHPTTTPTDEVLLTSTPTPKPTDEVLPTSTPTPTDEPTPTLFPTDEPTATPTDEPTPTPDLDAMVQGVLKGTNALRAQHGCAPLQLNDKLIRAAQLHAEDMARNDYFSHTALNGSTPFDRIRAQGYEYRTAAENIAAGVRTPEQVIQMWTNSEGHRRNMLNCDLHELGVGYYSMPNDTGNVNYTTYWVQVFGTP